MYQTYATGKQQCEVTWRHGVAKPLQYQATRRPGPYRAWTRCGGTTWHVIHLVIIIIICYSYLGCPYGIGCNRPRATCRALGCNVNAVGLCYKRLQRTLELSRPDKTTEKKANTWAIELSFSCGHRVLRSNGPNHVNLGVHYVYP
jgi:hypothetical protein